MYSGRMSANLGEPLANPDGVASIGKGLSVEHVEGVAVEGGLEVLEGQGVLEDGAIVVRSLLTDGRGGNDERSGERGGR